MTRELGFSHIYIWCIIYNGKVVGLTDLFYYISNISFCFPPSLPLALSVVSMELLSPDKVVQIKLSA